eukprot:4161298-Prymnesium_polylepis.1
MSQTPLGVVRIENEGDFQKTWSSAPAVGVRADLRFCRKKPQIRGTPRLSTRRFYRVANRGCALRGR